MALDWTAIDTAIKAWLDSAAPSVTWMRGNQNAPLPAKPCGVWTWRAIGEKRARQGNMPDEARQASITTGQVFLYRAHRLQVDVYASDTIGTTAAVLAQSVRDSLEFDSVFAALHAAGLSLVVQGGVRDLTALFPEAAESRAIVEIMVQTAEAVDETVNTIATVEIIPSLT